MEILKYKSKTIEVEVIEVTKTNIHELGSLLNGLECTYDVREYLGDVNELRVKWKSANEFCTAYPGAFVVVEEDRTVVLSRHAFERSYEYIGSCSCKVCGKQLLSTGKCSNIDCNSRTGE